MISTPFFLINPLSHRRFEAIRFLRRIFTGIPFSVASSVKSLSIKQTSCTRHPFLISPCSRESTCILAPPLSPPLMICKAKRLSDGSSILRMTSGIPSLSATCPVISGASPFLISSVTRAAVASGSKFFMSIGSGACSVRRSAPSFGSTPKPISGTEAIAPKISACRRMLRTHPARRNTAIISGAERQSLSTRERSFIKRLTDSAAFRSAGSCIPTKTGI